MGGLKYSLVLIALLEKLCYAEDNEVRTKVRIGYAGDLSYPKAVETIKNLLSKINISRAEKVLMKMIDKFVRSNNYAGKTSAASLIPVIYPSTLPSSLTSFLNINTR